MFVCSMKNLTLNAYDDDDDDDDDDNDDGSNEVH